MGTLAPAARTDVALSDTLANTWLACCETDTMWCVGASDMLTSSAPCIQTTGMVPSEACELSHAAHAHPSGWKLTHWVFLDALVFIVLGPHPPWLPFASALALGSQVPVESSAHARVLTLGLSRLWPL